MNIFILLLSIFARGQSYEVLNPVTSSKAPVLVYLHGGAWVGGSSKDYRNLARRLIKKNVCVALVDYRLSHEAKHPAPVLDLEASLRDLKVPAGCDSHRIFLAGHSAGAHLIAYWATRNADPNVRGLIGIEGIYDLPRLVKARPAYADQFVKAEFGATNEWPAASPTRRPLKSKAPWLLVHSTADELVDLDQSTAFRDHLLKERVKVELLKTEGETHFGVIENLGESLRVTGEVLKFMGL